MRKGRRHNDIVVIGERPSKFGNGVCPIVRWRKALHRMMKRFAWRNGKVVQIWPLPKKRRKVAR